MKLTKKAREFFCRYRVLRSLPASRQPLVHYYILFSARYSSKTANLGGLTKETLDPRPRRHTCFHIAHSTQIQSGCAGDVPVRVLCEFRIGLLGSQVPCKASIRGLLDVHNI